MSARLRTPLDAKNCALGMDAVRQPAPVWPPTSDRCARTAASPRPVLSVAAGPRPASTCGLPVLDIQTAACSKNASPLTCLNEVFGGTAATSYVAHAPNAPVRENGLEVTSGLASALINVDLNSIPPWGKGGPFDRAGKNNDVFHRDQNRPVRRR